MNPIYTAAIATVIGHKRTCPKCGHEQVVDKFGSDKRYHCKKCNHVFTREELKGTHKEYR